MDKKWYQKGLDWLLERDNAGKKWYKRRIVWVAFVIVIVLIMLLNPKDGKNDSKNISGDSIPNVFGITYTDAVEVLEADGYEVKAVETAVKGISDKLLYPLESVEKGSVFKIDDYILDGNGNLTLNYEILYGENMASADKNIVIYYAKEDYQKEDEKIFEDADVSEVVPEEEEPKATENNEKKEENKETKNNGEIGADFKSAMDSYEKFFDEYVAIMKKYKNNPSDVSILADYTKYMGKYAKMMEDFEKWEDEDMNTAEMAYYLEVQGRITKKLLEVSQ